MRQRSTILLKIDLNREKFFLQGFNLVCYYVNRLKDAKDVGSKAKFSICSPFTDRLSPERGEGATPTPSSPQPHLKEESPK